MTVAFHPPTPARGSTELAEVQDALSPTKAALSCLGARLSYFTRERRFTVRHTHGPDSRRRARYVSRV